ncbi:hypothetical protein L249_4358 [Ophiocordyceps polyrhachis-furcata BCC 54312]|uniref:F-box domain-containing protein n=1 Tax=Ophiocordyceps polyrhachis-furcata BCC 54312 TaxID=1330021 RepID=A0A367L7M2_9HYPO|nr:hypothetical protein L249_4358 [Ophiocordyceps polyrhachis-furcata BCC 54312]
MDQVMDLVLDQDIDMDQGHLNIALIPAEFKFGEVDCALCGVPIIHQPLEERAPDLQDFALEKAEQTRWLRIARLIGNHPTSKQPLNARVSHPAYDSGNGNFMVAQGQTVKTYHRREGHPFVVPFHNDCMALLRHYLDETCVELEIDIEVLFDAVNHLSVDDNSSRTWKSLGIPYVGVGLLGMVDPFMPGAEHLAMSPIEIPELKSYYENLPRLSLARPDKVAAGNDIFSRLDHGIMANICRYLETNDIAKWRSASRSAARLDLDNDFWQTRVGEDMPWLFDFPDEAFPDTDWAEVYSDLSKASQLTRVDKMLGLANRRRIWEKQGPFFHAAYKFADNCKNYWMRELARYVGNFEVKQSLPLSFPPPLKTAIYLPTLLCEDLQDLDDAEPYINLSWTVSGTLAGIDVMKNGRMETLDHRFGEDHVGSERMMPFDQRISIPLDDWVTGLVMYCSTQPLDADLHDATCAVENIPDDKRDELLAADAEDQIGFYSFSRRVVGIEIQFAHQAAFLAGFRTDDVKLVHADPGRFVVGFRIERQTCSAAVTRVGLVMAPITPGMPGIQRVAPDDYWRDHKVPLDQLTLTRVPPAPLRLCEGLGWVTRAAKSRPCEVLVLGETNWELSHLTSISVDDNLDGIRADYSNGPPRSIGWVRDERRIFDIDGQGGERIIALFLIHDPELGSWRFQVNTSRQRQLVIDQGAAGPMVRLPLWSGLGGMNLVGGIYATWLSGHGHKLAGVGCLTTDDRLL